MKAKKTRLFSPLLFLFTYLILFFSAPTFASSNMTENPLNLSTELTLGNNYNAEILDFWEKNAKSFEFQGRDNKKIHTISIMTGNNKAIVISQGRNESVFKYKEVAYDLHHQGYDVFMIDHRGQGLSERFGGDQYRGFVHDFQDYVDDLDQYITSLQLTTKYPHRYLLSHSMGGAISALYLEQVEHPFQAAVFFSPMLSINLGPLPSFFAKAVTYSSAQVCNWFSDKACYAPGSQDYHKVVFEGNQLTSSLVRFNASQHDFEAQPKTQLGGATMQWVSTSISATKKAINNAHKIDIPILLIQASADQIVTSTGQNAFFKNVTVCKFNQLLIIDGAEHEVLLEQDKYRLPALTRTFQFLAETTQGKQTCTK